MLHVFVKQSSEEDVHLTTPEFMMGDKHHVSSSSEPWGREPPLQSKHQRTGSISRDVISAFRNEQHRVFEAVIGIYSIRVKRGTCSADDGAFVKTMFCHYRSSLHADKPVRAKGSESELLAT